VEAQIGLVVKLPVSFDEVSYFNNEYRGDLLVTEGVLYYFPHTRVAYSRYANELGGKEGAELLGLLGQAIPVLGTVPWIHTAADKGVKVWKLFRRVVRPSINRPRIRDHGLWSGSESSVVLQDRLDAYINKLKAERLKFDEDAVPKPLRFAVDEVENARLGIKFRFDAKYDSHDFRVNPIHRNLLRKALRASGFLP